MLTVDFEKKWKTNTNKQKKQTKGNQVKTRKLKKQKHFFILKHRTKFKKRKTNLKDRNIKNKLLNPIKEKQKPAYLRPHEPCSVHPEPGHAHLHQPVQITRHLFSDIGRGSVQVSKAK